MTKRIKAVEPDARVGVKLGKRYQGNRPMPDTAFISAHCKRGYQQRHGCAQCYSLRCTCQCHARGTR